MTIEERIFQALKEDMTAKSSHFFSQLEKTSGIKASSWRHVYYGHQRATSEMIEFCCRYIPNYAYWIATGATPESSMDHLAPSSKEFLKPDVLEEIALKEPVDWTTEEVEIVARNLFGGTDINPALMRLMSDGMVAREKKKLLNIKGLTLPSILKKEPELWTETEMNYVLFKWWLPLPSDTLPYTDFVKANLDPKDSVDLDLIARQEDKIVYVIERAESMRD